MEPIKLIVPASTSNLGPGFDTLGLALSLRLEITARPAKSGVSVSFPNQDDLNWRRPAGELMAAAVAAWELESGIKAPGVEFQLRSQIPIARGLGSSAAYRIGVLAAVNRLTGSPLSDLKLLNLGCRLENHTDNATPCLMGGLTVSGWEDAHVRFVKLRVPERFKFVTLAPDRMISTDEARALLPVEVPRQDAVFNLQRALWLVEGLAHDQPELLCRAFEDRLHQPYREKVAAFMPRVIKAAEGAGAYGAFLSGSGSAMIAVTETGREPKVAAAMLDALKDHGENGSVHVLSADNEGLRFIDNYK